MLQLATIVAVVSAVSGFTTPLQYTPPTSVSVSSASSSSALTAASAAVVPNPFKKLPWNVKKEKEREMRRLKLERSSLHRELGIAEDASYEEIVEATDSLIAKAGGNLKKKIQIEVAKDKILQIRLNERLAGLSEISKDARAQSIHEVEGTEEAEEGKKEKKEWNAPMWTKGLIVKPDEEHRNKQIKIWGIATFIGLALPPAQDYLGRFTWLICVAQLTFRGMPRDQLEGGGVGMSFMRGSGGSHRKVAWLLGFLTWVFGAVAVYGLMPAWAKSQRWTPSVAFSLQNLIFGVACSYLQPYKG